MSTESKDLVSLVEKLRQEQEFVLFYKSQIRQGFQELNTNCDDVFHSLWLSHTLSHGLQRVLTHHVHCYEWSLVLDQEFNVEFVNASKALQSYKLVEPYSKFLGSILSDPRLLSEILYIAESEGLDCHWLVSDLMSVVFGHCIFQRDHTLFLRLLRELIKQHIQFCDSPKDLFGGVESVFNKVLAEYCAQLLELKTFLTELLQEAVMEVLMVDDYLEYDVHKAGSRFQTSSDQTGSLVDTRTFLFSEDLDLACEQLARIATLILEKLSKMNNQFPLSLKWLLTSLKSLARQKWPEVTQSELRRLTSDAIFGTILSSAIVNPDNHAIVEPSVVVESVARYNLTQVTTVLQRTAWRMDKQPIHKVIKRIDMTLYYSVVDSLDGSYGDDVPDLPSSLPGLKRSSFLASQAQLNNLVGLMATLLTNREGRGSFHSQISELLSSLPRTLIDMASTHPYSMNATPTTQTRPPTITLKEGTISTKKARWTEGNKGRGKKRGSVGVTALMNVDPQTSMPRSKSIGAIVSIDVRGGTNERGGNRFSPPVESGVSGNAGFLLPNEVLILPFSETVDSLEPTAARWGIPLLSEEEFMSPPQPTSPSYQQLDKQQPLSSDLTSPQSSTVDIATTPSSAVSQPVNISRQRPFKLCPLPPHLPDLASSSPGRVSVKDLVNQLEGNDEVMSRTRSNTLPPPRSPSTSAFARELMSEGGTPMFSCSPVKGKWVDPVPMLSPVLQEDAVASEDGDDPVINSSGYDKLTSKNRPYIASASSSLTNSPLSPGDALVGFAYEPSDKTTPPLISNGTATPTIMSNSVSALGESSHDQHDQSTLKPGHMDTPSPVEDLPNGTNLAESLETVDESELLLNQAEDPIPSSTPKKATKKKKIFRLFRRHKSTDVAAKGDIVTDLAPKPRSKSEIGSKAVLVALAESDSKGKVRSKSEHESLDEPGQPRFRKRRSYTLLTGDITAKYSALEAKRKSTQLKANVTETSKTNDPQPPVVEKSDQIRKTLERFDSIPPAEMSPKSFQKSLYCDQLKYKLRAALQNMHTPLSLSPVYLQLSVDEDSKCDTRYQLILLIQHSLQRSRWKHDSMEIALLTEILKMVEPLSNELVQAAVEGVYSDYNRRSAYIAYLVKSHQKFHDAKLQVAAFQSSVDRIKEVEREIFVNFAVHLFLEGRDSEVKQFSQDLSSLQLADEKCSLMERRQLAFGEAILEDPTWLCWGDMDGVIGCLDDHLFSHVYDHIFHPNGDSDTMRDQIFSSHLTHLSETISVTHKSLQIPCVYHSSCPWASAQIHLQTMSAYKSPRGKLCCIVRCCKILISLLQYAKCGDPPGADDMFPVIVYVVIKSNPPGLLSTIQYIKNFIEMSLAGEDAYWWAQFSTAVEFTKTLE